MINIVELERNVDGGVVTAHWTASKVDGDFTASSYGTQSFTPDATTEGFTAFEALTEEQVIGWFDAEQLEAIESALDSQLDSQKNPTSFVGKPW